MAVIALLSDRLPGETLPAIDALRLDLKTEPLSVRSIAHVLGLEPEAVLVDAAENPGQGHAVLRAIAEAGAAVADVFYPGAPEAEIRIRLAMLRRRHGSSDGSVIRLGPLALDVHTYRVTAA